MWKFIELFSETIFRIECQNLHWQDERRELSFPSFIPEQNNENN